MLTIHMDQPEAVRLELMSPRGLRSRSPLGSLRGHTRMLGFKALLSENIISLQLEQAY